MEAGRLPGPGAVCGCKRVSPEMGTATAQEVEDKWWMTLPNDPGRLLPKDGGLGQECCKNFWAIARLTNVDMPAPFVHESIGRQVHGSSPLGCAA